MKHILFTFCAAGCAAFAVAAVPRVSSVTYGQTSSHVVTVGYVLSGAPAIVTVDFLTNGVSVGAANFAEAVGDVNRVVQPGTRQLHWNPRERLNGVEIPDGSLTVEVKAWNVDTPPDYMVVDLVADSVDRICYYVCEDALPGGVTNAVYRRTKLAMRKIPAGGADFRMGSSPSGYDGSNDCSRVAAREIPRRVTLTNDFYLAVFATTRAQHGLLTGAAYDADKADWPAPASYDALRGTSVDWPSTGHAVGPASNLQTWRTRTGIDFDLPTSAQWEYACRAGNSDTTFYQTPGMTFRQVMDALRDYAWTKDDSERVFHPVGLKLPNPYGLYDLYGNIWEWCLDRTGGVTADPVTEPVGPTADETTEVNRVGRGGTYSHDIGCCRSAKVNPTATDNASNAGYRLCCPVPLTF